MSCRVRDGGFNEIETRRNRLSPKLSPPLPEFAIQSSVLWRQLIERFVTLFALSTLCAIQSISSLYEAACRRVFNTMTPTERQMLKRESTMPYGGLPTPEQSMTSTGSITPKKEREDSLVSDDFQALRGEIQSHHGLAISESFSTQATEYRKHRSASVDTLRVPPELSVDNRTSRRGGNPSHIENHEDNMEFYMGNRIGSSRRSHMKIPRDDNMDYYTDNPASSEPGKGLEIVGKKVKILVDAIEELRKLGLREIDTELPELVLVGDQSAGKSSLMSAIAEINLPKSHGKCTKCVANIKTSPADTWSCKVSLHEYYDYSPTKKGPHAVTKAHPFGPWIENHGELSIKDFTTITQKSEFENVLLWAQRAILNPHTDYRAFVPGTGLIAQKGIHEDEAGFSPNIISLEISGPNLPALSFYDLPGLFQYAPKPEEQYLIKAFENLVSKYIVHKNALILCAIPMSSDPSNSKSSALVGQLKAEHRCIGVLTMPDLFPENARSNEYDALLHGRAHKLPRGYFVTKQPGADFEVQGADYHIRAREEEKHFFQTNGRWTGEWSKFLDHCGTEAIQNYLSQEMARQIAHSMPKIDQKIHEQLAIVDHKLSALPELPEENVQHVVRERLSAFSNGVRRILEGGSSANQFLSSWSELSHQFRDAIEFMKPKFVYTDASDFKISEVITIDSDDDDITIATPPIQIRKRPHDGPGSEPLAKKPKFSQIDDRPLAFPLQRGHSVKPEEGGGTPARQMPPPQNPKKLIFERFRATGRKFSSITELRAEIKRYHRPGLPEHVDDAVRESLCLLAVTPWDGPLKVLADETFKMLKTAINDVLDRTLGHFKQTTLYREAKHRIHVFLNNLAAEQRMYLDALYKLETYKRFTINDEAFKRYKNEELSILQAARKKRRIEIYVDNEAKSNRKLLTGEQRAERIKRITDEQLGEDKFQEEIRLAGYVRGYYKTAGLRFADNLCHAIQGQLFKELHENIAFFLERELELDHGDSEARCRDLMDENPAEAQERISLQKEKRKLIEAQDRFAQLAQEYQDDNDSINGDGYGDEGRDRGEEHSSTMGQSTSGAYTPSSHHSAQSDFINLVPEGDDGLEKGTVINI
ncbi:hypothetical protein G7Y89_g2297 [Cudoniella acicularis]|uniref:GED domain-containing protein n=1 Tax=Cudoniella acicularis TaxID=354080 RepID=A0A8H4RUS5_9HELO|nr:hypothetical protein G7Y89_g2297 [Cudoniella acicularis]